jgi:PKD repeat protein
LTVTDTIGQTDSANKTVILKGPEPPVATFSFAVNHLSVTVDGDGSLDPDGTIVSYNWTFGDGGTAFGVTADHTYVLPGIYKVMLTLTDNDGLADSSTSTVTTLDGLPIASFTYTTSGLVIDVDASGSSDDYGIVSYNWDWGDGTTGTGVTASHTYATVNSSPMRSGSATMGRDAPTHYMVQGYTYGPDGVSPMNGCHVVVTDMRTGESLYPPHWQWTDRNVYVVDLVDLTLGFAYGDILNVTATNGAYIGWTDSPIIDNGGTEYLMIDVTLHSIPTMWAITLTVTDTIGQTRAEVKYVFVPTPSPPIASFFHNAYGLPVDVDASGSSGDGVIVSYVWDWGDGTTGYGMTASHTYAASVNSTPSEPYTGPPDGLHTICGFTYAADGVTVLPGCDVTLVNLRTGYSLTTTSDTDYGYYSVDSTWFELGWVVGDLIRVTATYGKQTGWTVSPLTSNLNGYDQIDVAMGSCFVTITLKVTDMLGQTASVSQRVELYL